MSGIDIKLLGYKDDNSFDQNYLNLQFSGKDINHIIMNSIRRAILDEIPNFAFNPDMMDISENSSVYNNDYLRNRFEQFPLIGIERKLDLDEYEDVRKGKVETIEDMNDENEQDVQEESLLTLYCDKENSTDEIMSVTSDDVEFYSKDKKIKSIYKNPILICKLKPGEKLKFSAKSDLGIALKHARYAVATCFYEYDESNKYKFKLEPRGQMSSSEVIKRSLQILLFRIEVFKKNINKKKFTNENQGIITLKNEDHTLGNLIARGLQDHKNIEFAGYKLEHLLIRDLIIEYVTDGGKGINEILNDVVLYYQKIFKDLEKKLDNLKIK